WGAVAGWGGARTGTRGPLDREAGPGTTNMGGGAPPPAAAPSPVAPSAAEPNQPRSANPLWAIPLKDLSVTRERPLFSPSRRPPAPAVAAAPYVPPRPAAKPAEPERPLLSLIGTVIGERAAIGIFLDQAANKVLRLKLGEAHRGWTLRDVRGREITLQKERDTVVLALPVQTATPNPQGGQPSEERAAKRGRN